MGLGFRVDRGIFPPKFEFGAGEIVLSAILFIFPPSLVVGSFVLAASEVTVVSFSGSVNLVEGQPRLGREASLASAAR